MLKYNNKVRQLFQQTENIEIYLKVNNLKLPKKSEFSHLFHLLNDLKVSDKTKFANDLFWSQNPVDPLALDFRVPIT